VAGAGEFNMTLKGASELHQAFNAAIEAKDANALNSLLAQHFDDVIAQFDSWSTIPVEIRQDQNAAMAYGRSLLAIAQVFEAAGEPALIERLTGDDETNPINVWNRKLSNAQALSEAGQYEQSTEKLKEVLAELNTSTGTGVTNLRPKVLGRLGYNALNINDYASALDYTSQAHEASVAAADEEGIVAYYENLVSLQAINILEADPERGKRLLNLRRLIVRAQDSADAGRYQASLTQLSDAVSIIESDSSDNLFESLKPKVYGLLGFNEYKLTNVTKAREHTALALERSKKLGDVEGIRIYSSNLELIDSS
jgi:hypothetical protein